MECEKEMALMRRISFLPRTALGKWSLFLFALFILSWMIPALFTPDIGMGEGYLPEKPTFLLMLSSILSGLGILSVMASFIAGILAYIWKKERSILVSIITIISLLFSVLIILFLSEGLVV
jgi:hypothetical protein